MNWVVVGFSENGLMGLCLYSCWICVFVLTGFVNIYVCVCVCVLTGFVFVFLLNLVFDF